ncbi:hypothetical protein GCM10023178_43690 [Actinomadura luteofluorescens]
MVMGAVAGGSGEQKVGPGGDAGPVVKPRVLPVAGGVPDDDRFGAGTGTLVDALDIGEVAVSPIPEANFLHGLLPKGSALGLPR